MIWNHPTETTNKNWFVWSSNPHVKWLPRRWFQPNFPKEKYVRQIGSCFPSGVNIKNMWNHHLATDTAQLVVLFWLNFSGFLKLDHIFFPQSFGFAVGRKKHVKPPQKKTANMFAVNKKRGCPFSFFYPGIRKTFHMWKFPNPEIPSSSGSATVYASGVADFSS